MVWKVMNTFPDLLSLEDPTFILHHVKYINGFAPNPLKFIFLNVHERQQNN